MKETRMTTNKNCEIIFSNIAGIKKHKKITKTSKILFKVFLFAILILGLGLAVIYFEDVKSLFVTPETTPHTQNPENKDENSTNPKEYNYIFKNKIVDRSDVINESALSLDNQFLNCNLPKITELKSKFGNDVPFVLIVHFSPFEAYSDGKGYKDEEFYSNEDNVTKIGGYIADTLNSSGINTLHLEDFGYDGSVASSRSKYIQKINEILENNPSITYIFDISRGFYVDKNMLIEGETVAVGEKSIPTIQFFVGTNNSEITNFQKNSIYLSQNLTNHINSSTPNLISKQTISKYDIAQVFSTFTLRINIGSFASSIEDALLSASTFCYSLTDFLID